mmetsp:Transcript_15472/g.35661  ORF Transcript_15472/g.35661 Transcript_15472/m.35661 type:complete len:438 (+) Transcript_15472:169-1482(+)|eukprot:CAMPEP_0172398764 /NCGR_PEP_ID=MMETSP1061-20121228/37792_1 /TAXON_ID=37318 /ORGANISM="Pseudo-nitzschia pungens, Strain cf. pungens" /LENGTH=437 /DNA_ID=CAMNT_0013131403 /DNA_START=150 /DNA_END=1463 /DNA_ORIENTATION=+
MYVSQRYRSPPYRSTVFLLLVVVIFQLLGSPRRSTVLAVNCEYQPDQGKCEVASCGVVDSKNEKNLYIPNAQCESAVGYREREQAKRSACIKRYTDLFDPAGKALKKETLCTVAGDIILEGLDALDPVKKLKWMSAGSRKVKKVIKFLEDKVKKKFESLLDSVDDFVEKTLKKLSKDGHKLYKNTKAEIKMIQEFYEKLKEAQLDGGEYQKQLKEFCESKLPSQNIGNIDDNVGFICEGLLDKGISELKKTVEKGYVELYKQVVDKTENYGAELKKFSDGLKKKSLNYLIEHQKEYENEILLIKDITDGIKDFKKNQRKKLIEACAEDFTMDLDAIAEACFQICNANALDEIIAEGNFAGTPEQCGCESMPTDIEVTACTCETINGGLWCDDGNGGGVCVSYEGQFGGICPCLTTEECVNELLLIIILILYTPKCVC